MRFVLAVFEAIRNVWPKSKPLGVRISATDWVEGGWRVDDSVLWRGNSRGSATTRASSGGAVPEQKIALGQNTRCRSPSASARVGIPTIAVGLVTEPRHAEEILAKGSADLVALGHGMLYNPRWPWHAAAELGKDAFYPPQCERSHHRCGAATFSRLSRRRARSDLRSYPCKARPEKAPARGAATARSRVSWIA